MRSPPYRATRRRRWTNSSGGRLWSSSRSAMPIIFIRFRCGQRPHCLQPRMSLIESSETTCQGPTHFFDLLRCGRIIRVDHPRPAPSFIAAARCDVFVKSALKSPRGQASTVFGRESARSNVGARGRRQSKSGSWPISYPAPRARGFPETADSRRLAPPASRAERPPGGLRERGVRPDTAR